MTRWKLMVPNLRLSLYELKKPLVKYQLKLIDDRVGSSSGLKLPKLPQNCGEFNAFIKVGGIMEIWKMSKNELRAVKLMALRLN